MAQIHAAEAADRRAARIDDALLRGQRSRAAASDLFHSQ